MGSEHESHRHDEGLGRRVGEGMTSQLRCYKVGESEGVMLLWHCHRDEERGIAGEGATSLLRCRGVDKSKRRQYCCDRHVIVVS